MTKTIARSLFPVALSLAVAGCNVGPDFTRPEAPADAGYASPDEQAALAKAAQGGKIDADWWTLFRSKDLEGVVRQALAGNKTLEAAQGSLEQASHLAEAAGGSLFPQVNFSAQAGRQQINMAAFGMHAKNPVFNLYQVGPSVSYSLDLFGKNRRQVEQAEAQAEGKGYQLDAAYLTLTGDVVVQALTIASVRAQIKAAEDIVADDERNLALVNDAKDAGLATQVEVLQADSQLAADRTQLPPLRQQLSVARHALAVLAGKSPAQWAPPEFDLDGFTLPGELPLSLPSALVRQRPDILAAEADLHAASAALGVATAARFPDITLSVSLLQQAILPGDLFLDGSTAASGTAGLLAPIFHGGELSARQEASEAGLKVARARYQQTVLAAFGQVADILQAIGHDEEEAASQQRAMDSAESSLRLTRLSFRAGNTGILQVLDAQRQLQKARLGVVRARTQRHLDAAQLLLAMGGGWWNRDRI